jgi:recombination protein RecA
VVEIETVPTGSLGLDIALGIGGLPQGPDHRDLRAGKLGQDHAGAAVVAEAQKKGGICASSMPNMRSTRSMPASWASISMSLLISQPDTGEQALEITDTLVRSGAVDVLVVDSVAALTPRAELEGEMGDSLPGLQARLMSQALRKLTGRSRGRTAW